MLLCHVLFDGVRSRTVIIHGPFVCPFCFMLYFLQKLVELCANRVVLFDNETKDEVRKKEQLKKLLHAVNSVISKTNGIPFSNRMFSQIKVIKLLLGLLFFSFQFSTTYYVLLLQEVHERQKETDGYMAEEMFKSKKDIYDGYLMLITKMVTEFIGIWLITQFLVT